MRIIFLFLFLAPPLMAMTVSVKKLDLGTIPEGYPLMRGWDHQTGKDFLNYHGKSDGKHLISGVGFSAKRAPFWLIDQKTEDIKILNLYGAYGSVIPFGLGFILSGGYGSDWYDGPTPDGLETYNGFPYFTNGGHIGFYSFNLSRFHVLNVIKSGIAAVFILQEPIFDSLGTISGYKYHFGSNIRFTPKLTEIVQTRIDYRPYDVDQLLLNDGSVVVRLGARLYLLDPNQQIKSTVVFGSDDGGTFFNVSKDRFGVVYIKTTNVVFYNVYSNSNLALVSSKKIFDSWDYYTLEANSKKYFYIYTPDYMKEDQYFISLDENGNIAQKCTLPYLKAIYPGMRWGFSHSLSSNYQLAIFDLYKGGYLPGGPQAIVDFDSCQIIGHLDLEKGMYTEIVKGYSVFPEDTIIVSGGAVFKLTFNK